jgi:hypothetical protein
VLSQPPIFAGVFGLIAGLARYPHPVAEDPTGEPLVEVLAYLITSARTQLDEAAEYAPMRILTAAQKLGDAMREEAQQPLAELISALDAIPPTATPRADRTAYIAMVDGLCASLADCLLALSGRDGGADAPAR